MVDDRLRSGAQGEFGRPERVVPLWPGQSAPARCPRGHAFDYGGTRMGWLHYYDRPSQTCRVCRDLHLPGHTWCRVDPTQQTLATDPDVPPASQGLHLVAIPPETRGGLGQIALWVEGTRVGQLALRLCGPCRVGVLEHVTVAEEHRRLGYGRLLIAAGVARGPGYRWSAPSLGFTPDLVARAFVAAALPHVVADGDAHRCTDMRRALGDHNAGL
ncbi:GNAT superfamily N-acetyltransferase [Prauserella isguenensis]|uniref:GNAT superfamily N-acetyltransferase n=1 Tax=Prauserella isguenensis TaxID=1470180 RepID=A0A839S822_9PSEU|nr:GNAT family N-acetyltransferase [Prauserella isguenensis]MBB3053532.1 GNAT superfamily N-acetyltransferase [Prauserella isguenensis]